MYVDIDQGIHRVKLKVARNEKQKNGFSFYTNIVFDAVFLGQIVEHKPLFSEGWYFRLESLHAF